MTASTSSVSKNAACKVYHNQAKFTDDQVLKMRRRYREARGKITVPMLVAEYGGSRTSVQRALVGGTYAHVPEAIVEGTMAVRRRWPPEVVLFMRLAYQPPKVTAAMIGRAYGVSPDVVSLMLTGTTYADVPGAVTIDRYVRRKLTPDQVLWARRQFRTGHVSIPTLARELGGAEIGTLTDAIRGYTFKEVPDPVPVHIKMRRTRMSESEARLRRRKQYRLRQDRLARDANAEIRFLEAAE